MQIPGRLRGTTLGDVLGALHRERASGVLELVETSGPGGGRVHRIRLSSGLVSSVETAFEVERLGEILTARGRVEADTLARLEATSSAERRRLGRRLVDMHVVEATEVSSALHEQMRRRLERLFSISDALIRFRAPRPRRPEESAPAPLGADEFLHGRPRARGERSSVRHASEDDLWAVFGLAPGATRADVRAAFRKLAAEVHPDRHPHAPAGERVERMRRLAELSSAYHRLIA